GHRAEIENKVLSIEKIDTEILSPVLSYLESCGEDFRIMVLPDHPTPIYLRTHTSDPVPFFIYDSTVTRDGVSAFCEDTAAATGYYVADGYRLMELLTK
ncbi:MAG: phosphoglycerate mutase, partial [Clostridia bacterium]|nr:phosphoglycerate mutase [Clostridia bacterium]